MHRVGVATPRRPARARHRRTQPVALRVESAP